MSHSSWQQAIQTQDALESALSTHFFTLRTTLWHDTICKRTSPREQWQESTGKKDADPLVSPDSLRQRYSLNRTTRQTEGSSPCINSVARHVRLGAQYPPALGIQRLLL